MNPPRSLLLIKPGSMGDVIHALPVASAIHDAWPETKITWIVDSRWRSLLDGNPAVQATHVFPRQEFRRLSGAIRGFSWFRGLGGLKPDLTLDLQGLFRSGLMARMAGGLDILGLSDAREGARFFYHRVAQVGCEQHAVDRYLACLPEIGIQIPEEKKFPVSVGLGGPGPAVEGDYIILHPFARGAGKSLSNAAVREFVEAFRAMSRLKIVIVGMGGIEGDLGGQVVDLMGKTTLAELATLMFGARFVVSVDSGPMHLAAALKTPLIGIHTWSDPRRVGPYSTEAWIWQGGGIRRQSLTSPPLPEVPFGAEDAAEVAEFVAARV